MKVIDLLSALDDETLEHLAHEHLGVQEEARASRCLNLESELRGPKHIRDTVFNLQPPAFRIIEALLDAPDRAIPLAGLRERAMEETMAIAQRVTQGSVLARLDDLALYRRILVEARRSDLHLDPSETAILAVLRRELGIHQVEHFLIEHHADLQPFWNEEHGFLRAMQLMRTGGLTFAVDGRLVLPEDVVAIVRQTVGLEMKTEARRRLLARISGQDATEILQDAGLKSTGSKEEKLLRIFDNYLPPSVVLDALGIVQLRDLCRDLGIAVSGAKDELSERVLRHFATDGDIAPPKPEAPPPEPEQRVLSPERFELLFQALRQQDLSDILAGIGSSRITGAKEHLVKLVRESRFSELTLLTELGLKQLEYALVKQHLKAAGNKQERAARLVQHFETIRLGAHGI